jgi:hypothetical protein
MPVIIESTRILTKFFSIQMSSKYIKSCNAQLTPKFARNKDLPPPEPAAKILSSPLIHSAKQFVINTLPTSANLSILIFNLH